MTENLEGLVGYYPFDGDTMDYSGQNNHAYEIGKVYFGADRGDKPSKSLKLDCTGSHLHIPNTRSLATGTDSLTIMAWIYIDEWDRSWAPLITKSSGLDVNPLYQIGFTKNGKGRVESIVKGNRYKSKKAAISINKWFHVAITSNEVNTKIYINGLLNDQYQTRVSTYDKNKPLEIGRGRTSSLKSLNGKVDELYIYSKVLNEDQIQDLMNKYMTAVIPESFETLDINQIFIKQNNERPATVITGGISYADATSTPEAEKALGPPKTFDHSEHENTAYSLGCQGEIILEFTDHLLVDVAGPDLVTFEVGPLKEPTSLSISKEGTTWIDYGEIEGGTAMIDLVDVIEEGEQYRFIKLTDLGYYCGTAFIGADIDAVGVVVPPIPQKKNNDKIVYTSIEKNTDEETLQLDTTSNTDRKTSPSITQNKSGDELKNTAAPSVQGSRDQFNMTIAVEKEKDAQSRSKVSDTRKNMVLKSLNDVEDPQALVKNDNLIVISTQEKPTETKNNLPTDKIKSSNGSDTPIDFEEQEKMETSIKSMEPPTIEEEIVVLNKKEIKIYRKSIKIKVWDRHRQDGDLIDLYLNGTILQKSLKVTKRGKTFDIEVLPGENIIEVLALNEGSVSPNTSAVRIMIKGKRHEIFLSAKEGERDSLKIYVE